MFRVLVLDDSPERQKAFAEALKGCQVKLVDTSTVRHRFRTSIIVSPALFVVADHLEQLDLLWV